MRSPTYTGESRRTNIIHSRTHRCICDPGPPKAASHPPLSSLPAAPQPTQARAALQPAAATPLATQPHAVSASPSAAGRPVSSESGGGNLKDGATLGRKQGTLAGWLAAREQTRPSPAAGTTVVTSASSTQPVMATAVTGGKGQEARGCGGTITVWVATDYSHPLGRMGIKGQKITVQVEHPGHL